MFLLYNVFLILLLVFGLPKFIFGRLRRNGYRGLISSRLGKNFPRIEKGKRRLIWLHAVSVGEVQACGKLAEALKNEKNILLVSTITETGMDRARKSMPFADHVVLLPFDLSWVIKPIVKSCAPDLLILCETDFWHNFITASKEAGAKVVLVNGKMSERSFNLFSRFSFFTRSLFADFDLLFLQNSEYFERFTALGVPPEKMKVVGNLKFDADIEIPDRAEIKNKKRSLGVGEDDLILVAGSTHRGEEKLIVDSFKKIEGDHPFILFIAPRHPERFGEVANLLDRENVSFRRYSDGGGAGVKVILVDVMGVLRDLYRLADIAFVGGTFIRSVGGHNILEPAFSGKPVIFGPHTHTQKSAAESVLAHNAGCQVTKERFEKELLRMVRESEYRKLMGARALKAAKSSRGALRETLRIMTEAGLVS